VPEIVIQGPSVQNVITNAAGATTEGVEAELRWKPLADLRITGDVTYDDAHYVNYKNASLGQLGEFCAAAANVGNPSCVATYGGTGNPGTSQDFSGRPTAFAPRWSGSVAGAYDISVRGYQFTPAVQILTSSKYFISNEDPTTLNPFYYRLDARLSFLKIGDHWIVDLIGKNLTDRDIITADQFWPNSLGSALTAKQERRNAAIQFRYQW
jgi:outer membrane receptor protein involved in Fe transport